MSLKDRNGGLFLFELAQSVVGAGLVGGLAEFDGEHECAQPRLPAFKTVSSGVAGQPAVQAADPASWSG